ncbi:DUF3822 family protein [Flavihumibacter rivuli]|uniref:DUF3822 family protein n=1 Tax=Flavihumibacter rivuli TaxID=2838156 RepID=UPI001BDE6069|nr:DUF3822 family protein [Flavihumibacter rivuli]ULQ57726.1 DUF3822 family protein [Flavihumibacter rivuli]
MGRLGSLHENAVLLQENMSQIHLRYDIGLGPVEDPANSQLLIQVQENSLHSIVADAEGQPLHFQSIQLVKDPEGENPLVEWFSAKKEWMQQWKKVTIVHWAPEATLVPAALWREEDAGELLDLQFGDLFKGIVMADHVPVEEAYTVYRVSKHHRKAVESSGGNLHQCHLFTPWLSYIQRQPKADAGNLYLYFESGQFALAVWKDQLQYIAIIEYNVPEDVSYYLLKACGQAGLSQQEVVLQVDGWIDTGSSLYQELRKYFIHVNTGRLPEGMELNGEALKDTPVHFFTPLIQMMSCVS